jgi:transcription-repair coupling factor (superfamily II helicase)
MIRDATQLLLLTDPMILSSVDELLSRVARLAAVDTTFEDLRRGARQVALSGLTDPARIIIAARAAAALRRPAILVVDSESRAEAVLEAVRYFFRVSGGNASQVFYLPALDLAAGTAVPTHPEILEHRALTLWHFVTSPAPLMVVPIAAALMHYRAPESYSQLAKELSRDMEIPLAELLDHLDAAGYSRGEMAEMPGQFAQRGGIVDIFPVEAARPVRIELLGDSIESIREFDPDTQRSVQKLERTVIPPLLEKLRGHSENSEVASAQASSSRLGTLFDLADRPFVILEEPSALAEAARSIRSRFEEELAEEAATEPSSDNVSEELRAIARDSAEILVGLLDEAEWKAALVDHQKLLLEELSLDPRASAKKRSVHTQPTQKYHGNIAAFMTETRARIAKGEQIIVSAASLGELERFADLCHEYELAYQLTEVEESVAGARLAEDSTAGTVAALVLARTPLEAGVAFPECRLTLFGTTDVFDARPVVGAKQRARSAAFVSDFAELKPGDYVVHVDHGIGQFDGLRQLESDSARGEFMLLRYADDAKLYVPLARMDLVQSFRAMEGTEPQLDRLGGTGWATRKARVKKSLAEMADQLLRIYATRKMTGAHAFPPDTPWQHEFEDAFEFDETRDQAAAIKDVKRDMERTEPMDRLLCGDVGYGKTEVAMRAAFKAVSDGKQVAILAPTTVLVFQHHDTFKRRLAAFPVRVDMLSRFRTAREMKVTLAALAEGKVDIIIGTHRLLSKDVKFHDLGLLVVDEEQRFGVAHKERIKEMRADVHVLTMSATPIPRTLHMSLAGMRDLSIIETPPKDRLAIQTVVAPFTEHLVKRAIEEELARKGQVFFIHNRVETIGGVAELVRKLVPQARVVVGHGQMGESELEKVMLAFIRDEADVLVSTTIVENGLDIPRANTILINHADKFGLSELYQLRGRVGRSNQRASAYLLVTPETSLTPIARRRLAALKEFSDLGAGFRIAALDLELRGAGNLLGRQQHGHINAVGFDLYTKMLERAVAELKGEVKQAEQRVTINLGVDLRIPPEYIPSENLRLSTYKRIAEITADAQREELIKELEDRFGAPPRAIENLLDYALLKADAEGMQVATIDRRGNEVGIKFYPQTSLKPEALVRHLHSREGLRMDPTGAIWITVQKHGEPLAKAVRGVLLQLQT